ncbi:MAG: polysaccharide deacetylase family protein, partial [Mycobacteriales bacterium]
MTALLLPVASASALLAAGSYWGVGAVAAAPARRATRDLVVSRVRTSRPEVALTFDDGPDPEWTLRIADALDGAPATFFVLGEQTRRHPEVVAELVRRGHEVACHGDRHRRLTRLSPRETVADLRAAHAAVLSAAGTAPAFFRPPHGLLNLAACWESARLAMRPALWSTSSGDWRPDATVDGVCRQVVGTAVPGSVVLLHDGGGRPGRPA